MARRMRKKNHYPLIAASSAVLGPFTWPGSPPVTRRTCPLNLRPKEKNTLRARAERPGDSPREMPAILPDGITGIWAGPHSGTVDIESNHPRPRREGSATVTGTATGKC